MHPQHIFDAKLPSLATSPRNMGSSLLHPVWSPLHLFQLKFPAPLSPYRVGAQSHVFPPASPPPEAVFSLELLGSFFKFPFFKPSSSCLRLQTTSSS